MVESPRLIVLGEGDLVRVRAHHQSARFLLVTGNHFNEPIVRYASFVMNPRLEIEQTLQELRQGTFIR